MMLTDQEIEALLAQTQTEGYPSDVRRLVHAVQAAERERCAVVAWVHYMDTCKKHGRAPSMWHEWCAADVIRGA